MGVIGAGAYDHFPVCDRIVLLPCRQLQWCDIPTKRSTNWVRSLKSLLTIPISNSKPRRRLLR